MKKHILLFAALTLSVMLTAQTQQGYVKTRGRMVNGKHIPGQGLKGATVSVQGRTAILVDADDGSFSFPVPAKTFVVQSVQKKGYQLVDADAVRKSYNYSANPIYLVMDTPEQQLQDQLESERKIRLTLQQQLQQKENELAALKAQGEINEAQYQEAMQRLHADQESNERLVADMAKQYAQMDYDQMDELNRRISDAILNGRLAEADSLLHSKGNLGDRVAEILREQQVETQRNDEMTQSQQDYDEVMVGIQRKMEDAAADCYKYFDLCKLNMEWDSAAYYIELRAQLDTTNAQWQYQAAGFFLYQNQWQKADVFYQRTLRILRPLAKAYPEAYEPSLQIALNDFAGFCAVSQRYAECEKAYLEALEIVRRLAKTDPQGYEPTLAGTLNNVALYYLNNQKIAESEKMFLEAVEIDRRLAKENPQAYEPGLAMSIRNLAMLYSAMRRNKESEALYLEALDIFKRQPKVPEYQIQVAATMNDIAMFYFTTRRVKEAEAMYLEALEMLRRLAKDNPQAYEPYLANALLDLGLLYQNAKRFQECEPVYQEALEVYRRLDRDFPQTYESKLVATMTMLARMYSDLDRYKESEQLHREALAINRRLAKNNPQFFNPDLASTLYQLGLLTYLLDSDRMDDAIAYLDESLDLYRDLVREDPSLQKSYENCVYWLVQLYGKEGDPSHIYAIYEEYLPILKRSYQSDPASNKAYYAAALDYQALQCALLGIYEEAERYAKEALQVNSEEILAYSNLAISLLLQGKYSEAEKIYKEHKDVLKDIFIQFLDTFEAAGLIPENRASDVKRARKLLSE